MGSLNEYRGKRQFEKTPEPASGLVERHGPLLFCVQQHAATRMHFDLRLELDGALRSWALPKGLPLQIGEKHLAVLVEDHPFDYASFEGVIPKGSYGGGEVIVYDCGTYSPDEESKYSFHDREEAQTRIRTEFAEGKISFFLRGERLKGSFALIRMKDEPNWLVIKHTDRFARDGESLHPDARSVLSGVSLKELEQGASVRTLNAERLAPSGRSESFPGELSPMLATPASAAFNDPNWYFEPKMDGYRTLAFLHQGKVVLRSRRGLDVTKQYPAIVKQLSAQNIGGMILDGEIVAFEADGKPSFNAMQKRGQLKDQVSLENADRELPCIYYVFDLLHFAGIDTRHAPQHARRRWLAQALLPDVNLKLVDSIEEDGHTMFAAALAAGFEGTIGKRRDSIYDAGKRSGNWLKIKGIQTSEFVVGGFLPGQGARAETFGSLLLGYHDDSKKLVYVGNVGSGFDDAQLADMRQRLNKLVTNENPFSTSPPGKNVFVKPTMVVEVKFHEKTPEGSLRAPVFLRERDDADPDETKFVAAVETGLQEPIFPGNVTKTMIDSVLQQLDTSKKELILEVGSDQVKVTSLDKVLWPEFKALEQAALTKRDLLKYLARVSPYMLRHLQDKPLTMIRFPEGIHGERFFQKHWDHALPPFTESVELYSGSKDVNHAYVVCNNLPTLLWLGQLGTLEFHVPHFRTSQSPDGESLSLDYVDNEENIDHSILNYPDFLVFDIDPYIYSGQEKEGEEPEYNLKAFEKGREVAFWIKDLMDSLGLHTFVKTSGKTGLHLFAPIIRQLNFDEVKSICETFSRHLQAAHPDEVTIEWNTKKRTGKIFMDYNMNVRGKTLNSAYSPRALPGAPVSMPVTWDELKKINPLDFRQWNIWSRLEKQGDVWENVLGQKVDLIRAMGG